jgi:hypothetical protein
MLNCVSTLACQQSGLRCPTNSAIKSSVFTVFVIFLSVERLFASQNNIFSMEPSCLINWTLKFFVATRISGGHAVVQMVETPVAGSIPYGFIELFH